MKSEQPKSSVLDLFENAYYGDNSKKNKKITIHGYFDSKTYHIEVKGNSAVHNQIPN